jgi:phage terminase large subunit-like protein
LLFLKAADDLHPDANGFELRGHGPILGSDLPWPIWCRAKFAHVTVYPFADFHERMWEWGEGLIPGVRPQPHIEILGRGLGKSTTAELICARAGSKLSRRFVLYVCGSQEQADEHVASIASLFETMGVERAVGKYGHSKGWRRNQLRTANGFNVAAYGLDAGIRGVKIDQYRPDLIILDDLDNGEDSLKTIEKKVRAVTKKILPTGSADCAILGVQNAIHEDSIFSQLSDGRADFLHDRYVSPMEPAVRGLAYEIVPNPDGRNRYKITAGEASWAGKPLSVCEQEINDFGLRAFLEECQHDVAGVGGYVFNTSMFRYCTLAELPNMVSVCLAWDLAATEGGGDHTVGVLMGKDAIDLYYVLAVIRGQWGSERVRQAIDRAASYYRPIHPKLRLRIPQDGGQAGKDQAGQFRKKYQEDRPTIIPVTGSKGTRASGYAEQVNLGNVVMVQQDLPDVFTGLVEDRRWEAWHTAYRFILKRFDENLTDQPDDDVDASADAFNELTGRRQGRIA